MFQNLKTDTPVEKEVDILGGQNLVETGLYPAKIKEAYIMEPGTGSLGLVLKLLINGREIRETLWFQSKKGKITFTDKNSGKERLLPGAATMASLAKIILGVDELHEIPEPVEKALKIYDPEQQKEVPKNVPVVEAFVGADIVVGMQKIVKNKQTKGDNGYVDTNEQQTVNEIHKVYHPETFLTASEIRDGVQPSEETFAYKWKEKYDGQTVNKFKPVEGGAPAPGNASAGGNAGSTTPSLFN